MIFRRAAYLARRTPIGDDTQLFADPHYGTGDDRSNRVGARRFRVECPRIVPTDVDGLCGKI
jgi:hypothetical protein